MNCFSYEENKLYLESSQANQQILERRQLTMAAVDFAAAVATNAA